MADFYRTSVNDESFIRGAARLLYADMSMARPTSIGNVIIASAAAPSAYDAQSGWNELGATKTGVQITVNNTEEAFDVDQIYGDIKTAPNSWECSVATSLAEATVNKIALAWEGDTVTTSGNTNEKKTAVGQATSYTERRLVVLFKRPNDKIRGYLFHKVVRAPQESTLTHAKTGEQVQIPVRFKALPDTSLSNEKERYFYVVDQA